MFWSFYFINVLLMSTCLIAVLHYAQPIGLLDIFCLGRTSFYVCWNIMFAGILIVIDFVRCHVANVQCWYPVLSFKFGISASTFKFMKWIYLVLCTYSCACFKLIFIVSSFLFHWHLMLLHLLCIMSLLVLKIEIHKI